MSVLFDDATPDSLDQAPGEIHPALAGPSFPITMSCWFKVDTLPSAAAAMCLMGSYFAGGPNDMYLMFIQATDQLLVRFRGSLTGDATGAPDVVVDRWYHACARFTSNVLREMFLDFDLAQGSNTTDITIDPSPNRVSIGQTGDSSVNIPMSGRIEDACWWNVALNDGEIRELSRGAHPQTIRRQNLIYHFPLTLDTLFTDVIHGAHLVPSGSPIISGESYPRKQHRISPRLIGAVPIRKRFAIIGEPWRRGGSLVG